MKRSQLIGALLAVIIIVSCFMPWSYIASQDLQITGMETAGTRFGKPGILHIFFSVVCIILFSIQKLWSKRTNIFVGAMNLSWCIRNFILVSTCSGGECQVKLAGIYVLLVACAAMFIMTLLPKIALKEN